MSKINGRLLDVDLDVVTDKEGHQLIRKGAQTFGGTKTFDTPTRSLMSKAEADNTAVTKAMLKNATRCMNTIFEETLTVTAEDVASGSIMISKDIPDGKESSLDITYLDGAGPLVNGVDFGAETDKIVLTGYPLADVIQAGDKITVQYMICAEEIITLDGIVDIVYSPDLGRFVCACRNGDSVELYWSDDGKDWTKAFQKEHDSSVDYDEYGGIIDVNCLIWNTKLKRFSAVCFDSEPEGFITGSWGLTSNDGKTWTEYEIDVVGNINDAMYSFRGGDDGEFFKVEGDSIFRSQDGLIWTFLGSIPNDMFSMASWANGYFYLETHDGDGSETPMHTFWLYSSKDGVNWKFLRSAGYEWDPDIYEYTGDLPDDYVRARAVSDGKYSPVSKLYVFTYMGTMLDVSRNGEYWTSYRASVPFTIDGWYEGINAFLGKTDDGTVVISGDGMYWWMLPGFDLPDRGWNRGRCWAANKDMMLTWSDDVIEVYDNFTSNIRGASRIPITMTYVGLWSVIKEGGGGGTPGGGSGGTDEDEVVIDIPTDDEGWYHLPYPSYPGRPRT